MAYVKTCVGCGTEFSTQKFRQTRCQPRCRAIRNKSRSANRLAHSLTFVAVDGEGVDRPDGAHEYVMLSVGDRTLWNDGYALGLGQILSFLWECYTENQDAAFVGFFLGYDFVQWQKLLPERQAYLLLTNAGIRERTSAVKTRRNPFPDAVVWEGWEIDVMASRRWKLRPHTHRSSMFNDTCRNRTCNFVIEFDPNDPGPILEGENLFEPIDGPDLEFPGWIFFLEQIDKAKPAGKGWMYICDTGPFWQTSFVNVIDPKNWGNEPVCTEREYQTVIQGKNNRGTVVAAGVTDYFEEMREYNVLENTILARVTERLNKGFMNEHIPIRIKKNEWYGPGRAAQLWMDSLHARIAETTAIQFNRGILGGSNRNTAGSGKSERRNEWGILNADVYSSMPTWFGDAARSSYYGGWFEQFVHGHVGDVWEYDINSAYPFIIASLPCLHTDGPHTGKYSRGQGNNYPRPYQQMGGRGETRTKCYTLIHATITGSDPYIGVMPFRTRTGNILRPHVVRGWYWLHEVQAAIAAGLVDSVDTLEWCSFEPCDCPPVFNPSDIGIERMYNLRLEVGKNSPQGKAFKLVYNSAYGKTAQSVGSPKYSNPVYASLITSGCRTLILQAIASHPLGTAGVSMVATDGVYFLERHSSLPLSDTTLGVWDETYKTGMTQLMPGVYWDDETRRRVKAGAAPKLKSRGVSARDLASQIGRLDSLFAQAHFDLAAGLPYEWPTINLKIRFQLVSAKLALQRGKWDTAGKVEHDTPRSISANPQSKRQTHPYRDDAFGGIVRTRPYREWTTIDSLPYSKTFGYDDSGEDEYVGRDGRDSLAYFRDLLNV